MLDTYPAIQRVLVTSGTIGFDGIKGFTTAVLAPLSNEKIEHFVSNWYRATVADPQMREPQIYDLISLLNTPSLRAFASNPLLLTTITALHFYNRRLPNERVILYSQAVDLLLHRWQQAKQIPTSSTFRKILDNNSLLHHLMDRLAYEAQLQNSGVLNRGNVLILLEQSQLLGNLRLADEFLRYISQRTGLLVERGPQSYSFVHRTFQEFLAGRYIVNSRQTARLILKLLEEDDYWLTSIELGIENLIFLNRDRYKALDLAYDLCPISEPKAEREWNAILVSAYIASLLGREEILSDQDSIGGGESYLTRIKSHLENLRKQDQFKESDKIKATNLLKELVDDFEAA